MSGDWNLSDFSATVAKLGEERRAKDAEELQKMKDGLGMAKQNATEMNDFDLLNYTLKVKGKIGWMDTDRNEIWEELLQHCKNEIINRMEAGHAAAT